MFFLFSLFVLTSFAADTFSNLLPDGVTDFFSNGYNKLACKAMNNIDRNNIIDGQDFCKKFQVGGEPWTDCGCDSFETTTTDQHGSTPVPRTSFPPTPKATTLNPAVEVFNALNQNTGVIVWMVWALTAIALLFVSLFQVTRCCANRNLREHLDHDEEDEEGFDLRALADKKQDTMRLLTVREEYSHLIVLLTTVVLCVEALDPMGAWPLFKSQNLRALASFSMLCCSLWAVYNSMNLANDLLIVMGLKYNARSKKEGKEKTEDDINKWDRYHAVMVICMILMTSFGIIYIIFSYVSTPVEVVTVTSEAPGALEGMAVVNEAATNTGFAYATYTVLGLSLLVSSSFVLRAIYKSYKDPNSLGFEEACLKRRLQAQECEFYKAHRKEEMRILCLLVGMKFVIFCLGVTDMALGFSISDEGLGTSIGSQLQRMLIVYGVFIRLFVVFELYFNWINRNIAEIKRRFEERRKEYHVVSVDQKIMQRIAREKRLHKMEKKRQELIKLMDCEDNKKDHETIEKFKKKIGHSKAEFEEMAVLDAAFLDHCDTESEDSDLPGTLINSSQDAFSRQKNEIYKNATPQSKTRKRFTEG